MIAYLDCHMGVTPKKLLAAMVDCGLNIKDFKGYLEKLNIPFALQCNKETAGGIEGLRLAIDILSEYSGHSDLSEIKKLIVPSGLRNPVKRNILKIYEKIVKAESKTHKEQIQKVVLHEIGHPASILCAAGIIICMDLLDIKKIYASPVALGSGKIKCSHGILKIPAPATIILTRGIPTVGSAPSGELTTPTGAAILSLFSKFDGFPAMAVKKIGWGIGRQKDVLGIYLGEKLKSARSRR